MSRISRYVFSEVLGPSFLGLTIYTFVLLMNAIFDVAELAIKKDLPLMTVLKILGFSLPQLLALTIPMSVLLGVLIGVGRLSSDSELIALRACGVGYRKVILPVLALGALGWLLCSAMVLWVEPRTNYARHRITSRLFLKADFRKELKPRVFFEDFPGMLLYADKVFRGGSSLERVILYQNDPEGRDLITTAKRGRLDYDSGTGRIRLLMEGGLTHRSDPGDPVDYQVYGADRQMVLKEAGEGFKLRMRLLREPQQKNFREQSLRELKQSWQNADAIEHLPTRVRLRNAIEVVFQERFALPLACLVFSLIGFPLGIYNRRGGKSSGIALCLGVVLVYWLLLTTGENLAYEGKISPFVALWTGNVLFALAGTLLIIRRDRREVGEGTAAWIGRVYERARILRAGARDWWKNRGRVRKTRRRSPPSEKEAGFTRDRFVGGAAFSTLIDRYVLGSFLRYLIFTSLSIYIIFLVVDFRGLLDDLLQTRAPGHLVLSFLKYRTPWVVSQILPVACLVATLLSFGVLSRFNEVTAMKAGGWSLYRISVPVLVSTVLLSAFVFALQDRVIPFSNQRASQIRDQIRGRPPRSYSQPQRRWILGKDGLFYNYRTYTHPALPSLLHGSGPGGLFQGFSAYRLQPASFGIQERVYAREAVWTRGVWTLRDGWVREFGAGGEVSSFERFEWREFRFAEDPGHFLGEVRTPDQMSYVQLRDFITELKHRGYSVQELMVGLYEKLALPFVSLVMVVLGLPFAFRSGRKGSLYGIGLSIGLVVVYYATFAVMSSLGEIGFLPPFLAAWAPNILFAGAGSYLMLTLVRT